MRVLLINPPSCSPQPVMPLGIACLGAVLEKNNIYVEAIDAWVEKLNYNDLANLIKNMPFFDLIGITVMSPVYSNAVKTINAVKTASPESKIIIGGTHPSSLPEESMRENPAVDFAADGEGDELIVQLAKSFEDKNIELSKIKGLIYRDKGKIIFNGKADPVKDIDNLPFPARHLFPIFKYRTHPPYRIYNAYATMVTSRGCPYNCVYCAKSVSGQNYRCQSAERVTSEIEFLINKYKIKQVHFYDDDFTINMKRAEAICDMITERKIKIYWSCVTRVDLVNENLLRKMKKAGCWLIAYGVESGNQKILDNVRKGYSVRDIKEAFKLTKKVGIRNLGYFMAGLPGETYETLDDTVKLSMELDPDFVSWSVTALYPGSELFQKALAGESGSNYKKIISPAHEDTSNISSQSPYAQGYAYIYEGDVHREFILKTVGQAYSLFYFRIRCITRLLLKMRTLTEFFSYLSAFFQFLNWRKKRISVVNPQKV